MVAVLSEEYENVASPGTSIVGDVQQGPWMADQETGGLEEQDSMLGVGATSDVESDPREDSDEDDKGERPWLLEQENEAAVV